ncbi:MAG: sodium/solute symporter [Opitutus sp.]
MRRPHRLLFWCLRLWGLAIVGSGAFADQVGGLVTIRAVPATSAEWTDLVPAGAPRDRLTQADGDEWRLEDVSGATVLVRNQKATAENRIPLPELLRQTVLGRASQSCLVVAGIAATPTESKLLIASYNIVTDRWHVIDRWPVASAVHLAWVGKALWVKQGEGATATVVRYEIVVPSPPVRTTDVVVVAVYLAAMLGIGLWCSRGGGTSTTDYFLADRGLNWFVGGVTLYATATSAISFISVPAKSFATNWQYMAYNYVTLVGTTIAAVVLIPRLRRMNLVSVFEYLETRFHPSLRIFSSAVTILYNLVGKQAVVILLPALVMQQLLGLAPTIGVVIIGVLTTIYTVIGGFRAVVWTDLVQCFIMLGGAAVGAWWICHLVGTDLFGMLREGAALGKTTIFNFDFNLVQPTFWAFLFTEIFNVITWPKDQTLMQRVFATKNERHACGSVIFMAALVIPGATTFFMIGTALFLFYRQHPERFVPTVANDSVFPLFIAWEMPAGLAGLLIAAILAASMSTLSSGISSVATLVRVDFLDRFPVFAPVKDRISNRGLVLTIGVIATGFGVVVSLMEISSLLDFGMQVVAVFGGGFAAAYGLGLFTRRARWEGVLIGTVVSAIASFFLVRTVSPILMPATTIGISLVVGYVSSLLLSAFTRPLAS